MSGRSDEVEWVDRPLLLAMARAWWAQKMPTSNCTKVQIKGDGRVDVWWCDSDESGRYTLPVTFIDEVAASATKAAVQAERDDGWQDIATAPKGKAFIAAIHHGQCGYIVCEAKRIGAGVHGTSEGSCVGWRPGHPHPAFWQPFPAPPRTPEAE